MRYGGNIYNFGNAMTFAYNLGTLYFSAETDFRLTSQTTSTNFFFPHVRIVVTYFAVSLPAVVDNSRQYLTECCQCMFVAERLLLVVLLEPLSSVLKKFKLIN